MLSRSLLRSHLLQVPKTLTAPVNGTRYITTSTAKKPSDKVDASPKSNVSSRVANAVSSSSSSSESRPVIQFSESGEAEAPSRPKNWLTRTVETSGTARWLFGKVTTLLGYNSPKQMAGRRAFLMYEQLCAVTPDAGREFWQDECDLPPTFQSWFTITNLHVWMLTVRLRALPPPHGNLYQQFLLDHFFLDIEDRIRAILQPYVPPKPTYTFISPFYVNPNIPADGIIKRGSRAPERLVTRQMRIFKEQWMGMGMSFDIGMFTNDMELAGAVWRNLLGARGAQGIAYPDPDLPNSPRFRRSVNLVGGAVVNPEKVDFNEEAMRDDGSGVYDYPPEQVDKYVRYPELMLDIVTYVRRELKRLEDISDEQLLNGLVSDNSMKFGPVRSGKK